MILHYFKFTVRKALTGVHIQAYEKKEKWETTEGQSQNKKIE